MDKKEAKAFIKLGTSVRYLKDIKYKIADPGYGDEPLGGKYVIPNIQTVLRLTPELGFVGTVETGSYGKLQQMLNELNEASKTVTSINTDQANRLSEIAEKIRESLFGEGKNISVYFLDENDLSRIEIDGWPDRITLELLHKTPFSIWKWFVSILIAAFILGITVSETGFYSKVKNWFLSLSQTQHESTSDKYTEAGEKSEGKKDQ